MSERENNVYKAKLAEQAERYDGEYNLIENFHYFNGFQCDKKFLVCRSDFFFSSIGR
jgi:hypothetical protein